MFQFWLTKRYLESKILGSINFGEGHVKNIAIFFVFLVVLLILGIEGLSDSKGLGSVWFCLISHLTNI
jgi:hypothetical protein